MQYLKQSTAVTLKIGPFLDDTDGKTAETMLTIVQADVKLSKNGGDIAQKTEATSCTHDELGIYGCPIDATDTATLGRLQLWVHESGALPVWHEYMVVPTNIYDSLFSTDKLQVDVTQLLGTAWLTPGVAGTPDVNAKLLGGTAQTGNDVGADVNDILTDTGTTLDTLIKDIPTLAEFNADVSLLALEATLTAMKGATFDTATDSLEAIRDRGDATWITGAGGSAADTADAVLDEILSEHSKSGSLGEKMDGIRTRVPVSPWSKKDIDRHFEIIEAIAKAMDALPTVEKLNLLSKETKELYSSSQVDSQKIRKQLEQSHNAQTVTTDTKLKSRFNSLQNQIASLNEKVVEVQDCIPDGKVDFSSINNELGKLQKVTKEFSESNQIKSEEVEKTLQQINETFKKIENTPFDKFSKYLKAMFIANLKTDVIRSLLSEDLDPIKEVLREEEDG